MDDKIDEKEPLKGKDIELIPLNSLANVQLSIYGMKCTSCSSKIERALKKIRGVKRVSVNLVQEKAEIEYEATTAIVQDFIDAIIDNGFKAQLLKSSDLNNTTRVCRVKIGGMVCSSCSTNIEKALKEIKGIINVNISLALGEADVEYNKDLTSIKMVIEMIVGLGFKAELCDLERTDDITLEITGMSCNSCVNKIEKTLKMLNGINSVAVSLVSGYCLIKFNPEIIGPRDLILKIKDLGFGAKLKSDAIGSQLDRNIADILYWKTKLRYSLILAIPVFLMAMVGPRMPNINQLIKNEIFGIPFDVWFKFILTTIIQFFIGWRFQIGAIKAIRHKSANMDVLIALGTDASYAYSLISVLSHYTNHHSQDDYEPTDFFETSAMLITFIFIGKYLEAKAKGRTTQAITKLINLAPDTAILTVINKNQDILKEEEISADLVQIGDYLKVYPGSRVPVDGEVSQGNTYIDESMITGESTPVPKHKGDQVTGGTVNMGGAIIIKATRVGSETALSQIVRLIEHTQMTKAPIQQYADKMSSIFVPLVIVLALITFISWYVAGRFEVYPMEWIPKGHDSFLFSLLFGIAVLVIACPCALGLATPTAVMVGTGIAAQLGILIKSGEALEKAHKINTVVFDKTGTLTEGRPLVVCYQVFDERIDDTEIFSLAAAVESNSEHPLSRAVLEKANNIIHPENNELQVRKSRDVDVFAGSGIVAWVETNSRVFGNSSKSNEVKVSLGNMKLMSDQSISVSKQIDTYVREKQNEGYTVILVGIENTVTCAICVTDPPKSEAKNVISHLEKQNIQCYMLTGDNWRTARVIANRIGFKNVMAEVLPASKAQKVSELQKQGNVVAMIGDGINDSPALVTADIGMAIGSGTDIAIEAADYVLMRNNLEDVVTAIDLSKKTYKRIQENYIWAFGYNVLMIPIAAGILYPSFRFQLPPWIAGGAMALSSVSVVCSSLLLRRYQKPRFDLFDIDINK